MGYQVQTIDDVSRPVLEFPGIGVAAVVDERNAGFRRERRVLADERRDMVEELEAMEQVEKL